MKSSEILKERYRNLVQELFYNVQLLNRLMRQEMMQTMINLTALKAEVHPFVETLFDHIVPLLAEADDMLYEQHREFVIQIGKNARQLRSALNGMTNHDYSEQSSERLINDVREAAIAIIGYSDLLLSILLQGRDAELNAEQKARIREVRSTAREILSLIN
jgi:hypothetical protein